MAAGAWAAEGEDEVVLAARASVLGSSVLPGVSVFSAVMLVLSSLSRIAVERHRPPVIGGMMWIWVPLVSIPGAVSDTVRPLASCPPFGPL